MAQAIKTKSSPTIKRILKEAKELGSESDPAIHAAPLESDLFEWHFTIRGPPSSPYEKGIYHGRIVLPPTYPLAPPSFRFLTPSGRFETNREICLSISGHHEETWQPAWGIRTALSALRAFMEADSMGQVGGLEMSSVERQRLALQSTSWSCVICGGRSNIDLLSNVFSNPEPKCTNEPSSLQHNKSINVTTQEDPIARPNERGAATPKDTCPIPAPTHIRTQTPKSWIDIAIFGVILAILATILKRILS